MLSSVGSWFGGLWQSAYLLPRVGCLSTSPLRVSIDCFLCWIWFSILLRAVVSKGLEEVEEWRRLMVKTSGDFSCPVQDHPWVCLALGGGVGEGAEGVCGREGGGASSKGHCFLSRRWLSKRICAILTASRNSRAARDTCQPAGTGISRAGSHRRELERAGAIAETGTGDGMRRSPEGTEHRVMEAHTWPTLAIGIPLAPEARILLDSARGEKVWLRSGTRKGWKEGGPKAHGVIILSIPRISMPTVSHPRVLVPAVGLKHDIIHGRTAGVIALGKGRLEPCIRNGVGARC